MNWNHVFTIAKKDIREAAGNRAVWVPMVIVPIIFVVILPLGLIYATTFDPNASASLLSDPDMAGFLERMPAFLTQEIEGLNTVQSGLVLTLGSPTIIGVHFDEVSTLADLVAHHTDQIITICGFSSQHDGLIGVVAFWAIGPC